MQLPGPEPGGAGLQRIPARGPLRARRRYDIVQAPRRLCIFPARVRVTIRESIAWWFADSDHFVDHLILRFARDFG